MGCMMQVRQGRWHPARTLNPVIDLRSGPGFVGVMDMEKKVFAKSCPKTVPCISTLSELQLPPVCSHTLNLRFRRTNNAPVSHNLVQKLLFTSTLLPRKWL